MIYGFGLPVGPEVYLVLFLFIVYFTVALAGAYWIYTQVEEFQEILRDE